MVYPPSPIKTGAYTFSEPGGLFAGVLIIEHVTVFTSTITWRFAGEKKRFNGSLDDIQKTWKLTPLLNWGS